MKELLAACAAICLSSGWAGGLAQNEFEKYCRQMTGRAAPAATFATDPSLDATLDEYRIVGDGSKLTFTGANDRALLYAVYDYLERQGCRFYWDGDSVPKRAALDLSDLDVREKSRFAYRAIRYFAHRGLSRFQAELWGFEDWKREIDYLVKNRVNTFMLRIGQDDLFQKAFPDICPYPDPAKPCPEAEGLGGGYNDRSLFWSLQYRGELRKKVLAYARERGLMAPEDFGTMSHWYSRTPYTFLDKMKPDFLPQEGGYYGHPTDRVWDIRQKKWLDAYWKLTQAAIDNYGRPDILHTIGIAERHCYTNRADNLKMKVDMLNLLVKNAKAHYPQSQILFAGWDFYNGWKADEVGELLKTLNPKDVLIWDYEADAHDKTNFTEWDIVGKYPYTFGIFENLVQGLDIRMDYARIRERQKIVRDDPMCRGYIFWPESSHADILGLSYFTRNAWKADADDVDALVADLCRGRYGDQAAKLEPIWKQVVAVSTNCCDTWRDNCGRASLRLCLNPRTMEGNAFKTVDPSSLRETWRIFDALAGIRWEGDFLRRDTVDLARTAADRLMLSLMGSPLANARHILRLMEAFTDLLALHTDYSLAESYDRLDRIEKIRYSDFDRTLFENAVNGYCASHHYEAFRHVYLPWWSHLARHGEALPRWKVRETWSRRLKEMRPTLERSPENWKRTMIGLTKAARACFEHPLANEARIAEIVKSLPDEPRGPGVRIDDRAHWDRLAKLPDAPNMIRAAERVVQEDVPDMPPPWYLEWFKTDYIKEGDSRRWREPFWKRSSNLQTLLVAECLENKGRFLKRIIQYLELMPTEAAWTEPIHDMSHSTFDGTAPFVDLGQAERCAILAHALDLLKPVLPKSTYEKAIAQMRTRVFLPYLSGGENWSGNNWNAVCNGCTTRAVLALEPDKKIRARFLEASERTAPYYLNGFAPDGYCGEGLDYWNYGYSRFITWGLDVRRATGGAVDLFKLPRAREAMAYAYTFALEPFKAPRVSDGSASVPSTGILALGRLAWPDLTCERAETFALLTGGLDNLANRALDTESVNLYLKPNRRPYVLPPRTWFPDAQFYFGRPAGAEAVPFSACVKGGHNGVPHNHNDVGSFIVMMGGVEMVSDPGGEEYTKRTFSPRRYESKILNSYGHATPVPGGVLQAAGVKAAAKVLSTDFTDARDVVRFDLKDAYPLASLTALERTVAYDRVGRSLAVSDRVACSKPETFETSIITFCKVERTDDPNVFYLVNAEPARKLKVEVSTGGRAWTLREEQLENPKRRVPTRLAVALDKPVSDATITIAYTAL